MIITCPNCNTNYQIAQSAIGAEGRKVVCANCHQQWRAKINAQKIANKQSDKQEKSSKQNISKTVNDKIFSSEEELELDKEFAKQEQIEKQLKIEREIKPEKNYNKEQQDKGQEVNKDNDSGAIEEQKNEQNFGLDDRLNVKNKKTLNKQRQKTVRNSPTSRIKQHLRIWLSILIIILLSVGIFLRDIIVEIFPQFAKIYTTVGLEVNLVGLEFLDVQTINVIDDGVEKLLLKAKIVNITNNIISVPPIIIEIIDDGGNSLIHWNVAPMVKNLKPREILDFETRLEAVPKTATNVKLTFAKETK